MAYRSNPIAVFSDGAHSITSAAFNVVTGDALCAVASFSTASSYGSVTTNDVGETHTQAGTTVQNGGTRLVQAFFLNATGNAAKTVTYTANVGSDVLSLCCAAYSEVNPTSALDLATPNGTGTSTAPASGATATRAQAYEQLIGGGSHDSASSPAWSAGSNLVWNKRAAQESASHAVCVMEDVVAIAAGTEDARFSTGATSVAWMAEIMALKATQAGGGATGPAYKDRNTNRTGIGTGLFD